MVAARSEWWRDDCLGCFDRIGDIVRRNLTRIIRLVRADVGGTPVEILVTTYWNVFKEPRTAAAADGSWTPYDRMARRATLITNQAICAAATAGGAACIDLFRPFKGDGTRDARSLLGPDLDHPNARGHQLIATTLARHGWRGAPA
jgi:lysophospholipase L1-like esterase